MGKSPLPMPIQHGVALIKQRLTDEVPTMELSDVTIVSPEKRDGIPSKPPPVLHRP